MGTGRARPIRSIAPWQRRRRRAGLALGVVAVLITPMLVWRIQLRGEINQRFADIRAQGLPLTVNELVSWESHASDEAAADAALEGVLRAYHEMDLQTFGQLPGLYGTEPLLLEVPYPASLRAALESRVRGNEVMLDRLNAASAFSGFRTIRDLGKDYWGSPLSLDRPMEVLFARVCLLAEDGQGDAALDGIMTGIKVTRSCRVTPLMQALNGAVSSEHRIISAIFPVAIRASISPAKWTEFETVLLDKDWPEDVKRAVVGTRCVMLESIGRVGGPMAVLADIAGFRDLEVRNFLRYVDEVPVLAMLERSQREARLAEGLLDSSYTFWWGESPGSGVSPVLIAALQYRQAQGVLPEQPEVLVPHYLHAVPQDPQGKGPVRIHHDSHSITVYGVGPNGVDDGGAPQLDLIIAHLDLSKRN